MNGDPLGHPDHRAPIDKLVGRHRHVTVLAVALLAQLLLLGYQLQTSKDVPILRHWAVTAVTPLARVMEFFRRNTIGFLEDYVVLTKVKEENRRLANDNARLKLENRNLQSQVQLADRMKILQAYQGQVASKTIAATVIGASTNLSAHVVYVDRGAVQGVKAGMPVITPDGIVGKVVKVFPADSQVLLLTDQGFAASVVSGRTKVHGMIRGQGEADTCRIDFVQSQVEVKEGDLFYTSGNDRIFPKGFPVGRVTSVREKGGDQQVFVRPFMAQTSIEEVLIVIEGVHGVLPDEQVASTDVYIGQPPPGSVAAPSPSTETTTTPAAIPPPTARTEADRLLDQYRRIGAAQGHTYGAGGVPNFNIKVDPNQPVPAAKPPAADPPKPSVNGVGGPFVPAPKPAAPAPFQPSAVKPAKPAQPAYVRPNIAGQP